MSCGVSTVAASSRKGCSKVYQKSVDRTGAANYIAPSLHPGTPWNTDMPYVASKLLNKDKPGFSISFRHPRRRDSKGKFGLKVRRGLGTSDSAEADRLVSQMNEILADESWWTAARFPEAHRQFDSHIVDAFYDELQAGMPDSQVLREEAIPMPGRDEGYARVLFVGTTGAGKTSLLRHLIGSDPEFDRFPSTSTAKTTVSDIEVIPADGAFEAVVTFSSNAVVQANVEDCVLSACTAVWEELGVDKVAERFLNHPDQRFRLGYILGNWRKSKLVERADDDWDFGDSEETDVSIADDEAVPSAEAEQLNRTLEQYISRITSVAEARAAAVRSELLADARIASAEDREAALEIFQSVLFDDEEFIEIVHDVMEDIESRFAVLPAGQLTHRSASRKWPICWTYTSDDRDEFLKQVRWFSSNYAPSFGRLLTPLVDGMRIKGPLYPSFTDRRPRVVLLDGQGLGHTPDSSSSVTTHITKRFADVDAILLVDNAAQPIQAAAQSVMRTAAASGYYSKLLIAFTHFDQVKGLNLPGFDEKRAHVLASVHNYLGKLRETLHGPIVSAMERAIDDRCLMLGGLQGRSKALPAGVRQQIGVLLDFIEATIEPAASADAQPTYDPSGLGFAVQRAADSFQKHWSALLNLVVSSTVSPEHWTRVKALNRRISNELDVEYSSLRPVADLVRRISEEVANFLDHPTEWSREPTDDAEAQAAIAPIRQAVFNGLHDLALTRIVDEHLVEWRRAMDQSGKGSAARRAQEIRGIYELAAPVPGTVNTEAAIRFMKSVREIVQEAVRSNGGSMRLAEHS